jgi:GGDEF domain-containing protein
MTRLRLWIVAVCAWLFAFGNVERLHAPINIASFVYVLTFGVAITTVLWKPVGRAPGYAVGTILLAAFVVLKAALGYPIAGPHLPLTITEGCAVIITLALARQLAKSIDEFERAAADALLMEFDTRLLPFENRQTEIYREIRRARQFSRPLSLVTIGASDSSVGHALARLLEEAQRKAAAEYVSARLAELLTRETDACGVVSRRNGHFVVVLPESDAARAREVVERLKASVERHLGLRVRAGLATFPDQEVTFAGLLERAEAEMQSSEFDVLVETTSR